MCHILTFGKGRQVCAHAVMPTCAISLEKTSTTAQLCWKILGMYIIMYVCMVGMQSESLGHATINFCQRELMLLIFMVGCGQE